MNNIKYKDFYSWLLKESDDQDEWEDREEDREEYKIKGEYWIQEGSIQFADGDVGDYNHESIVILHAKGDVFNYLDINVDPETGDFETLVEKALRGEGVEIAEDYDLEEAFYNYIKENFSDSEADKCRELYRVATDRTDLRMFAKKHWGWIWVRGNDVGVYELTPQTIKYLTDGIDQIISDSGDEDVLDEDVYLFIGVDKTKKHYHEPLSKLKEGRFGSSSTKADSVKKSAVINKLDQAIQHPFYKDRMDENEISEKMIVYHGTSLPLKKFDPKMTAQGIIWFSSSKDNILSGEAGAQSSKYILTCEISSGKYAGWKEYEELSLGELRRDGFKGAILPDKDGFDGFVLSGKDIKILKIEKNEI